jgi:hypothetical protein
MTVSTHPSGGKALNWSLLHTRQWADKKFISEEALIAMGQVALTSELIIVCSSD